MPVELYVQVVPYCGNCYDTGYGLQYGSNVPNALVHLLITSMCCMYCTCTVLTLPSRGRQFPKLRATFAPTQGSARRTFRHPSENPRKTSGQEPSSLCSGTLSHEKFFISLSVSDRPPTSLPPQLRWPSRMLFRCPRPLPLPQCPQPQLQPQRRSALFASSSTLRSAGRVLCLPVCLGFGLRRGTFVAMRADAGGPGGRSSRHRSRAATCPYCVTPHGQADHPAESATLSPPRQAKPLRGPTGRVPARFPVHHDFDCGRTAALTCRLQMGPLVKQGVPWAHVPAAWFTRK
jgi:hypothetical protein